MFATLDLSPARWIWYPMGRCLPITVVLFRCEMTLAQIPAKAVGYLLADSRYKLTVNGKRVQWGPLLDEAVGLYFDSYYFHLHSGQLEPLKEAFPRLKRFFRYLTESQVAPVINIYAFLSRKGWLVY